MFVRVPGTLWDDRAVGVSEVDYNARKCCYLVLKDYTTNKEGVIN